MLLLHETLNMGESKIAKFFITSNPGFHNKGDAALLEGTIKCLRTMDHAEIFLFSGRPDFDTARCDVPVVGINYSSLNRIDKLLIKFRFVQYLLLAIFYRVTGKYLKSDRLVIANYLWKQYCDCDVIVAGLDDSFTTIYGASSFYLNFFNILLGKLLKKNVVLYGGSIGPFKKKWFELLGRYILSKPDLITLREIISYEYLRKIGVKNSNMHVTADLAFAIDAAPEKRIAEILNKEGIMETHKPLIGASFSRVIAKWAYPDIQDTTEKYDRYSSVIAKVLDDLAEKTGATIVFIPHVIGHGDYNDDRNAQTVIRNKMKNKHKTISITNEYSAGELRGLIGKCDFFIGARTHSQISAAMMHVPFVAIEYESFKTRGIIGKMLDCESNVYNIHDLDYDSLHSMVFDSWSRRASIKTELEKKMAGMNERVSQNVSLLKELMQK